MTDKRKDDTGQTQKTPALRRVAWALLKILGVVILLFVLFLIGVNVYLKSNQTKIFRDLAVLNDGSIAFDRADISVFKHFPSATITLENVVVQDARVSEHGKPIFQFGKLYAAASLKKLMGREIKMNAIDLADGSINFFTDEEGYNNLKSFFSEKNGNGNSGFSVVTDGLEVSLSNVAFHFTNALKSTNIQAHLNTVSSVLHKKENGLAVDVDLDVFAEKLAFKKDKGSFASNSDLSGKLALEISEGVLRAEPFELSVDNEKILFSGRYDTRKVSTSILVFEIEETRLNKVIPLLQDNIKEKLEPYEIGRPFYSKTTLNFFPQPDVEPLITVGFRLEENDVMVRGYAFEEVNLQGYVVNRHGENSLEKKAEKSRFKIVLDDVTANYDAFALDAPRMMILTLPGKGPSLKTDIKVTGRPSGISKFLENDKFFFRKGKFELNAAVDGPLLDIKKLIIGSEAHLELNRFSVVYEPSNTAFPLRQLKLYKKREDADFSIVSSTLSRDNIFLIDGGMKNMQALLFSLSGQANSDVNFVSDKMSWTDFIDIFGENGYLDDGSPKGDREKKKSMKSTVRGIQYSFQPRLTVDIDTLHYYDKLELRDFHTGVHFKDETTVVLEKTRFKYGDGAVDFEAVLDISDLHKTPFEFELHAEKLNLATLLPPLDYLQVKLLANLDELPENLSVDIKHRGTMDDEKGLIPGTSTGEIIFKLDDGETILGKISYEPGAIVNGATKKKGLGSSVKTKIAVDGAPAVFNEFLKTERFIFDKGHFNAHFEYDGDVRDFQDLLDKGNARFQLYESEVRYAPGNVSFPLTAIELELRQGDATFEALIESDTFDQKIDLAGSIENLSELVVGNTGQQIKTVVDVKSQSVKWAQFLGFLQVKKDSSEVHDYQLKKTTKGILNAFNPDLTVFLDTFIYSEKLRLREVQTGLSLADTATLILDKTGFKFHEGSVALNGTVNLGVKDVTPFTSQFNADQLDVALLLEGLDYLDLPSLANLEKLTGQTTMYLNLMGTIDDVEGGLVPEETHGLLDFKLSDISVRGYAPLDALAVKLLMKKRFEEVSFSPIYNRVEIQGGDIEIPLMEIQSNAIHFFLEGTFSYGDNTNMWVSIPLANLLSADRSVIPEKEGYAATKRKIYIEVTTDENGENNLNIHLRKKKFYKQRGMPKQYRIDRRRNRQLRKEMKRNKN